MTNTVETSEELIAKAMELCGTISEFALDEVDDWEINLRSSPDNGFWKDKLVIATGIHRLATTHLAEMDEHEKVYDKGGIDYEPSWSCVYDNCYEITGKNIPCEILVTKAKRLLGVE